MDAIENIYHLILKPFSGWLSIAAAFYFSKHFIIALIKQNKSFFSLFGKIQIYAITFLIIVGLSYFWGKNLGTRSECHEYDDNPLHGRACLDEEEIIDFVPTHQQKWEYGISRLFLLGIPAFLGIYRGYRVAEENEEINERIRNNN